ncbi:MAG: hypothetical protein KDA93_12715 [Planctomycetaceae bacterium]|nr:hypothetical protein [Planctomycetaceae bacterium]
MFRSAESVDQPPRRWSSHRKLLFKLAIVLATIAAIEVSCLLILIFRYGSPSSIRDKRRSVAASTPESHAVDVDLPMILHPYQGAILKPIPPETSDEESHPSSVSVFGFFDERSPIHKRSDGDLLVAVVGGSVAREMTQEAGDVLRRELASIPEYEERSITIIPLAVDGYKQPQQLMTISYLMTLGAEFDIVINLDGLNEAALPAIDNVPAGVFTAFPRQWGTLVNMAESIEMQRRVGLVTYLRLQDRNEARWFDTWPLRSCQTATLIWQIRFDRRRQLIHQQQDEIRELTKTETNYCASGPPQQFDNDQQMYNHCIDLWQRSSVLLNSLCEGNGIRYFHFLQPNQYLAGSKPMTPKQESLYRRANSLFRDPVINCYPEMRLRGNDLTANGVNFTDLTQLFAHREEEIYADDCCHVNTHGSTLLAEAIASVIVDSLSNE